MEIRLRNAHRTPYTDFSWELFYPKVNGDVIQFELYTVDVNIDSIDNES